MDTIYRVMIRRSLNDEPELWSNYGSLEDASEAARALVVSHAVSAWVVRVSANQGEGVMPTISRERTVRSQ